MRGLVGNGVKCQSEIVVGGFADFGGAIGVLIVENFVGAQSLDKVEVVGRGSSNDLEPRQLCVLDGERSSSRRSAVYEDSCWLLNFVGRERYAQRLVETLADGGYTNAKCGGVFERQVIRDLDLEVPFGGDDFRKGTVHLVRITCAFINPTAPL